MVATTRSKSKKPDVSSSTNQVKDATPKKLGVSSSSVSTIKVKDSTMRFEIPELLYQVITEAASIRESLRTNKNDEDLKRLYDTENRINLLAMYYESNDELPSSWIYNHETAVFTHVPKPPKPPKKKKIKRIIRSPPIINGIPLNEEEQKVWKKFKKIDKAVKAHQFISFPMEKGFTPVEDTDPLVDLIGKFAVDAFNKFYQTYVNKREDNVYEAKFRECKYYKLTSKYHFYMTVDAMEQGKPGVYEAALECDPRGARTLNQFVLTNREPDNRGKLLEIATGNRSIPSVSQYEKSCFSDSSSVDFYRVSGMVKRKNTKGGGFDYLNPASSLHRYILYDGQKNRYRCAKFKPSQYHFREQQKLY